MIRQGKNGSISFWFENKIVGSLPLGKRTMKDYYDSRDKLLREALEEMKLKDVKRIMWKGLHKFKEHLYERDNEFICMTILCLIKLRQIDEEGVEEGFLVMGRKKPPRGNGRRRVLVA